jgi:hypothetical protein
VIFYGKRDLEFCSKELNSELDTYKDTESRRAKVKRRDDNVLKKRYTRKNSIYLPALNIKQLENRYTNLRGSLRIFHQNIRGIKDKINEFMIHIETVLTGIIFLMEHHLTDFENEMLHFLKYKLGATFCRKKLKNGGSCIYIHEDIKFTTINVQKHGKDLEIAAVQIRLKRVFIHCTLF